MASEASYAFTFHIGAKSYILFINSLEFDIENNVNFVILKKFFFLKKDILKMWFLWLMWFWNCDFCEKYDFENVIFVKNWLLKMRFCLKMWFW